ncbi:MAG TPA: hypothetical protein EYP49_06045 [Anaerolineae bacterium]|nr:hypothetical protein [Anaerolineae bacterium]
MRKQTLISLVLTLSLLLVSGLSIANAAPPAQEGTVYTVQLADSLWNLSEKYLGNGAYYWVIVYATNQKSQEDPTFARITNPRLLVPGWKLLIPDAKMAEEMSAYAVRPGKDKIVLGVAQALTGKYARTGEYELLAFKLWVKKVNEAGGLLGLPVELVVYDCKSDSKEVVSLYEKLVTVDKVDLVLAPYSSSLGLAASTVTEKYGVPMVLAGSASEPIYERDFKWVFGSITTAGHYTDTFFDFLETVDPKPKTVAVTSASTLFPVSVIKGAIANAEAHGMEVVHHEEYEKGITDLGPLLTKIKAKNPDIYINAGYLPDAVAMTRQAKEIDFNPKAMWFSVGPAMPDFAETVGVEDAEYIMGGSQWEPIVNWEVTYGPSVKEFVDMWLAEYGEAYPGTPEYHNAEAYASCLYLQEAIERAGTIHPEKVREALATQELVSFFGPIKRDETGKPIGKPMLLIQNQAGERPVVWPPETATASPKYPMIPWTER